MNCQEIEKYLPLYPNDVEFGIREEIDSHIQQCYQCRATLEKLNLYKLYVESVGEPEVPSNYEMNVLNRLEVENKPQSHKQSLLRFGFAISSAAALVIIFLLFTPSDKPWKDAIETNFVLKMEKGGKGPSELIDFNKIDKNITKIISETGTTIEEEEKNLVTGYYDYLTVSVSGSRLAEFIDKFNNASVMPINIPKESDISANNIYLKIYFDMVNFAVGNFDGDKHADLIAQFISGKYKGKWFLYKNDDSTHFKEAYALNMDHDETKYLGDYWLLSGDFDGNGYDDICLFEYSNHKRLTIHTLMNGHNNSFREAPVNFMKLSIPKEGEFVKIVTGDADGNGSDDLIWIAKIAENSYQLTAINIDKSFELVRLPDLDSENGIIVTGDLNGDKYFDLCVKYFGDERGGDTDILLNNHNFAFAEPYSGRKSFQGDYLFWCNDYHADGFDDLIVKSGGLFISGNWYILPNNLKADFLRESEQFTIKYPSVVK